MKKYFMNSALVWFLLGTALIVAEMILPGFIVIFFGIGAWITALSVWLLDIPLTWQLVVFTVSSVGLLLILRQHFLRTFTGNVVDGSEDDRIGKIGVVTKPIRPGVTGEVKALGSFWRAQADEDLEEGVNVVISEVNENAGLVFKVSKES